ncbi:MAG TPA: ABC transporter ATP-binding protein [Acidimicrobiales bacterium]|nr:ABC transporter ATP-binding protein [Acidimicrobiales bacterium]
MAGGVEEDERLDRGEAAHVIRRTFRRLRPYRKQMWLAGLVVMVWTGTVLAGPALVRYAIDQGLRDRDTGALNLAIGLYVGVAAVAYVVYRAQIVLINRIGEHFLRDLRLTVFDKLQKLSMPFYDREKAGVIVSRMTSDVDSLSELVQMGLLMFVSNGLLLVFSLGLLVALSWQLSLVCLIAVPFVLVASVKFQRDSNRAYLDVRNRIGQTLSNLQEGIAGVRVIQAFGREEVEADRFGSTNRELFDSHMRSVKISAWYLPVIDLSSVWTTGAVVGVGGYLVHQGDVTIGTVAAFILLLSNLFEPIQQLSQLFNLVQSAGAALNKLYRLLDTPIDVPDPAEPSHLGSSSRIVVENVSFAYAGGPPVLRDVSLEVDEGERLALVGPTGAGKSTLAKLMARLYDPTEGRVLLGDVDLRDVSIAELRRRIVVVPQEGFLFNATIGENIRIARGDATDDDVRAALGALGIEHRFLSLPEGLDTEVQERGSRFSAGEKQLVSLARAALVDPQVLVLDEATSSLDPGTELLVERALERLMEGRTSLVIAHRLSTAQRCDRVAVVQDGLLVEIGPHDELVAKGGAYADLFASWSGGLAAR